MTEFKININDVLDDVSLKLHLFPLKLRDMNLNTHLNIKICIKIWVF